MEQDIAEPKAANVKKVKLALKQTKPINGVVYIYDPKTMDIFDPESVEQMKLGLGEPVKIGKIVKQGTGFVIEKI